MDREMVSSVGARDDQTTVERLQSHLFRRTYNGKWVSDGRGSWFDQANYHWYFFQTDKDVCTEELVHPPGIAPNDFNL